MRSSKRGLVKTTVIFLVMIGTLCGILACGGFKLNQLKRGGSKKSTPQSDPSSGSQGEVVVRPNQVSPDEDSLVLERDVGSLSPQFSTQNAPGPNLRLLPVKALKTMYTRVFGVNPRKISPFAGEFFTPEQESLLKLYVVSKIENGQPIFNMVTATEPTGDYFAGLRSFLGRSCDQMIRAELLNESNAANRLVSVSDAEIKGKINQFYSSLLGYESTLGLHFGTNEFSEAFANSVKAEPVPVAVDQKLTRRRESYVHLCIALSMDPRVFTR